MEYSVKLPSSPKILRDYNGTQRYLRSAANGNPCTTYSIFRHRSLGHRRDDSDHHTFSSVICYRQIGQKHAQMDSFRVRFRIRSALRHRCSDQDGRAIFRLNVIWLSFDPGIFVVYKYSALVDTNHSYHEF